MSVTRIVKIGGFRGNVISGRDLNNIFEDDVIYKVDKTLDEIIITPIGKSARILNTDLEVRTLYDVIADSKTYFTQEEWKTNNKQ